MIVEYLLILQIFYKFRVLLRLFLVAVNQGDLPGWVRRSAVEICTLSIRFFIILYRILQAPSTSNLRSSKRLQQYRVLLKLTDDEPLKLGFHPVPHLNLFL